MKSSTPALLLSTTVQRLGGVPVILLYKHSGQQTWNATYKEQGNEQGTNGRMGVKQAEQVSVGYDIQERWQCREDGSGDSLFAETQGGCDSTHTRESAQISDLRESPRKGASSLGWRVERIYIVQGYHQQLKFFGLAVRDVVV